MKKLMIVAAVALAAVCSQAASFKWSASGVKGPDGETPYTGTATLYAYLATATEADAFSVATQGMTDGSIKASSSLFDDSRFVNGSDYNFYYTMTDAATGKTWTSGPVTEMAQALSTPTLKFYETGSWSGVPEPTSGLLLLLGGAGLALRRRRA